MGFDLKLLHSINTLKIVNTRMHALNSPTGILITNTRSGSKYLIALQSFHFVFVLGNAGHQRSSSIT